MAQIPRSSLDALTERLNALSEEGKRLVRNVLRNAEWDTVAELREILVEAMEAVCATVSDHSAALTAEFYDELREGSVGEPLGAVPHSGRDPKATEGAVRAFVQSVVETGATDALEKRLMERVDYEVKRASGECVKANAAADPLKPRLARVPAGAETCGFCIMLASRGFVYRTEESAGSLGHYHSGCDCRIVPGFPGDEVEGYDPDFYYDMWKHPEKYEAKERGISRKRHADSSATVDLEYVKSREYRAKFDGLTGNIKADEQVYKASVAALTHRNGTSLEDLHLISVLDGTVKASVTSSRNPLEVGVTKDVQKAVSENPPGTLFATHNHPSNIPPSGSDFVASGARQYAGAVVALHDGTVYYYKHGDTPFNAQAMDMTIDHLARKHHIEDSEAAELAFVEFEERFGITWRKL